MWGRTNEEKLVKSCIIIVRLEENPEWEKVEREGE
jgi:hypothetical protein